MKSDPQFYKIFKSCPFLFQVFAPINLDAGYRFDSRAYKSIDRTCDGIFEAADEDEPTYIVEFQVKKESDVYPRLFLVMALYQLENPNREVRGVIIIPRPANDPKPPTWFSLASCGEGFRVLYLIEVLAELPEDHPLVAVFKPFLESNEEVLAEAAPKCVRQIRQSNPEPWQREELEEVFFSWLSQRFRSLSKKEVMAMFDFVPLEETRFYKEVKQEGHEEGHEEGREEANERALEFVAALLKDQRARGEITEQDLQKRLQQAQAHFARSGGENPTAG